LNWKLTDLLFQLRASKYYTLCLVPSFCFRYAFWQCTTWCYIGRGQIYIAQLILNIGEWSALRSGRSTPSTRWTGDWAPESIRLLWRQQNFLPGQESKPCSFQYKVYAYSALVVPVLKTEGNMTSVILFVSHKSKPSEYILFGTEVTNKRSCTSTLLLPTMTSAGRTFPTYVLRKALASVRWQLLTDVQCDVIAHVLTIATACMLLLLAVRLRSAQTLAFVPQHMKQFHNLWCSDNDRQCMLQCCVTVGAARHLWLKYKSPSPGEITVPSETCQIKVYVATFIMYS